MNGTADHLRRHEHGWQVAHAHLVGHSLGRLDSLGKQLNGGPTADLLRARRSGIDCVVADTGNRLQYLRRNSSGTWAASKNLNGTITGIASGLAPATATRTCFIQGTNRTLQRIYFNGTTWGAWQNLGGALYSAPSCVLRSDLGTHCFGVGSNGALQQKRYANGAWQNWVSLGGALAQARPACVTPSSARLDCFARGTSNALDHIAYY